MRLERRTNVFWDGLNKAKKLWNGEFRQSTTVLEWSGSRQEKKVNVEL
jgi:hypothetical protein